jgi:hypothetical protein
MDEAAPVPVEVLRPAVQPLDLGALAGDPVLSELVCPPPPDMHTTPHSGLYCPGTALPWSPAVVLTAVLLGWPISTQADWLTSNERHLVRNAVQQVRTSQTSHCDCFQTLRMLMGDVSNGVVCRWPR